MTNRPRFYPTLPTLLLIDTINPYWMHCSNVFIIHLKSNRLIFPTDPPWKLLKTKGTSTLCFGTWKRTWYRIKIGFVPCLLSFKGYFFLPRRLELELLNMHYSFDGEIMLLRWVRIYDYPHNSVLARYPHVFFPWLQQKFQLYCNTSILLLRLHEIERTGGSGGIRRN